MFPIIPANSATAASGNDEGIFWGGYTAGGRISETNLVSNTGVVSSDVAGTGTGREQAAGCEYGGDKGIVGYGSGDSGLLSSTNLISNTGVASSDVTGVGTARYALSACSYGEDKGIFGYGYAALSMTNLVSNTGVVGTDVTGVGTARQESAACEYGEDKGIFAFGMSGANWRDDQVSMSNLVSNTGVVSSDVAGVGTARSYLAACSYGDDKGIFGYGFGVDGGGGQLKFSMTSLVSNTGVVSSDVTGVGTARDGPAATQYGGDKGIFGYGNAGGGYDSMTNLVSDTGVVSSDVTGVGTARRRGVACSFN